MRSAAVINNGLRMNLLIEYQYQRCVIAWISVMTIFIVYTLVYTIFSGIAQIWWLSGQILSGFFRLSPMKLVDDLRYGNPHNDMWSSEKQFPVKDCSCVTITPKAYRYYSLLIPCYFSFVAYRSVIALRFFLPQQRHYTFLVVTCTFLCRGLRNFRKPPDPRPVIRPSNFKPIVSLYDVFRWMLAPTVNIAPECDLSPFLWMFERERW